MGLLWTHPVGGAAQESGRVSVEENVRRVPNGVVLGRLIPGTELGVVGRDGNWLEVDVEGWVWLNSLQVSESDFDLVVSAQDGENLRDGPSGAVIGRLEEGTLLDELGREPGWVQVSRRGWIWSASVEGASVAASGPADAAPAASASPAAVRPPAVRPPAARPDGFARLGTAGAPILTAPDGDTLALATGRGDLEVVERDGNWARIRLDGWVWMPATGTAGDVVLEEAVALVPTDLTADPDGHVGRAVSWALQFISLERAEAVRTDFREGEPFLLTRFGGPDGPFVYVAVPAERLPEVEGLIPLERISVTARVRTAASALTGTPIVDLLSLEKIR